MPDRPLTAEELALARQQGIPVTGNSMIDEQGNITDNSPILPSPDASAKPASTALTEGTSPDEKVSIPGSFARQALLSILPSIVAGAAGRGGAALGALSGNPIVAGGAGLASALGGGYAGSRVQDKLLRSIADANPGGRVEELLKYADLDLKQHPWVSTAAALPTMRFAGGSAMPSIKAAIANPKAAAIGAGVLGGIDAAQQKMSGQPFDPVQAAISAAGALFTKHPSTALTRDQAWTKTTGNPPSGAPPPVESLPINQRPNYDANTLSSMTPEGHDIIAKSGRGEEPAFHGALRDLKSQGIDVTPELVDRIASEGQGGKYGQVKTRILGEQIPAADVAKQAQEAQTQAMLNAANEQNAKQLGPKPTKSAAESAMVIGEGSDPLADAAARQKTVEDSLAKAQADTQSNVPQTKSAEESAQAILAAQPRDVASSLASFRKDEAAFSKLSAQAEQYVEGSPEREMMTRALRQMRNELDAKQMGLFSKLQEGPERPGSLEEVVSPRELKAIPVPDETKSEESPAQSPSGTPPPASPKPPVLPGRTAKPIEAPKASTTPTADSLEAKKAALGIAVTPEQLAKASAPIPGLTPEAQRLIKEKQASQQAAQAARVAKATKPPVEPAKPLVEQKGGQAAEQPNPFRESLGENAKSLGDENKGGVPSKAGEPPQEERSFGLPKGVVDKAKMLNPIEFLASSSHAVAPSYNEAAKTHETLGPRYSDSAVERDIKFRQILNQLNQPIYDMYKGTSPEQRAAIQQYLYDKKDTGKSSITLPPELQKIADAQSAHYTGVANRPDMPFVREIVQGKQVERPRILRPNYTPESFSAEARSLLSGPETPEQLAARDSIIAEFRKHGIADPEEEYTARFAPTEITGGTPASSQFAALRRPEGPSIPNDLREKDAMSVALRYNQRSASDIAHHVTFEQDPQMAKAMGYETNGRGVPTPNTVLDDKGNPIRKGVLAEKDAVKNVEKEYVGSFDPEAQEFEKLRAIATAPKLGVFSGVRHLTAALNGFRNIMSVGENTHFITAAIKALNDPKGSYVQALFSGSLQQKGNFDPALGQHMLDKVSQGMQKLSVLSGREGLIKGGLTYADTLSRLLIDTRILSGDKEFFNTYGPKDWMNRPMQDVIDHVAANLVRTRWGTYTGQTLPHWLTRGNTAQAWAPFFALSRAPIGTFNVWKTEVHDEAMKGNFGPLLHSALGAVAGAGFLNWLKNEITSRKPQEMTWQEWLNSGMKDTPYTVLSKLQTAGYAGVLSHLALTGANMYYNQPGQGFNSPLFISEENLINRGMQYVNAARLGETGWLSGLGTLAAQITKDEFQNYRMATPTLDRGMREEKIAQRLGYMAPEENVGDNTTKNNPFSANAAYLEGNDKQAAQILAAKMSRGQNITAPASEYRGGVMRLPDGNWGTYYDFIAKIQGEEAARAAQARDIANSEKKIQTFSTALSR